MNVKRECPNCGKRTPDPNETICLGCGHATQIYQTPEKPQKKRPSFKDDVDLKGGDGDDS